MSHWVWTLHTTAGDTRVDPPELWASGRRLSPWSLLGLSMRGLGILLQVRKDKTLGLCAMSEFHSFFIYIFVILTPYGLSYVWVWNALLHVKCQKNVARVISLHHLNLAKDFLWKSQNESSNVVMCVRRDWQKGWKDLWLPLPYIVYRLIFCCHFGRGASGSLCVSWFESYWLTLVSVWQSCFVVFLFWQHFY